MATTAPGEDGTGPPDSVESRSHLIYIIAPILTALSTIIFSMRLYTRCIILKMARSDDWTMLGAQILAIVAGTSTMLEAHYGLGRHVQTLSASELRKNLIFLFVTIYSYNIGLNVAKISFLLQYRRIFTSQMLHRVCFWLLIFVGIWTVVQIILLSLACIPLAALDPNAETWCLSTLPIWDFTSVVSLFTDFAIFLIPVPCIWHLRIPPRQKVALSVIFGLGFFVCVVSIIRVPTLQAASNAEDPTWDNVAAGLWTLAEINTAILCSSLPILRPLFFKVSGIITGSSKRTISVPMKRVEHSTPKSTPKREIDWSDIHFEERAGPRTDFV